MSSTVVSGVRTSTGTGLPEGASSWTESVGAPTGSSKDNATVAGGPRRTWASAGSVLAGSVWATAAGAVRTVSTTEAMLTRSHRRRARGFLRCLSRGAGGAGLVLIACTGRTLSGLPRMTGAGAGFPPAGHPGRFAGKGAEWVVRPGTGVAVENDR